ncbi:MAG: hypothetical protein JWN39_2897, partial [Ilumatobacteraceae bacterium]|nr:hypothetical protein [Ilumatobacteraceae bacterium]
MNLRITRVLVGLSLVVSMTAAELVTSPASAAPPAPADTPTVTLSFTAAPTAADPGTAFTTAPVVAVTGSADPVVLSLVVVSGQASGELKCDALSVAQVASKATFANCKVDHGGLYRLHAALGAASAESAAFLVSGAAWVQFTGQPGGGVGGAVWTSQPLAQVVDGNGAVITSSTAKVGVLIKPGTGGAAATGAALTCTNVNNATLAVAGIATFSGCAINRAATGYQLLAIDVTDKVFGTSNAFDITAGTPAGLAFSTQPIGGAGGSPLTTQPVVAVVDAAGNRVPADTTSVSL